MPGDAERPPPSSVRDTRRARRRGAALVALAVALVPAALACGDDGRTLREPSPEQTTTSEAPTTEAPADDGAAAGSGNDASGSDGSGADPGSAGGDAAATPEVPARMTLTSQAFGDGAVIPARHTCRGADVSPPLRWTDVPDGTAELAIVVRDVDADGFVHWVIAGLPPDLPGLAEGTVPGEAVEAANDFGRTGWSGPCPPSGTHHYELRIYALPEASGVEADEPAAEAIARIERLPALNGAVLTASATAG